MKTLPFVLSSFAFALSSTAYAALPALKLNLDQTTVSGLSSGGYMAAQFQLAHADWVKGAAIVAAGPVYCAQNNLMTALDHCINKVDSPIPLADLNKQLKDWSAQGLLASEAEIKQSKIWLLHGTADQKISKEVADALYQQYQEWLPAAQLSYVQDKNFAHHMPTLNEGSACDSSEAPFLGKCSYDAAGEALKFIQPGLKAPADNSSGTIYPIEQQKIAGDLAATMAGQGLVYVPKSCEQGQSCTLHISFHGCNQHADVVGMAYVEKAGFNRYADSNNIVVLYPQTRASALMPMNPQACWDWWGYTDANYANRKGQQIQAVVKLAQFLAK
ncbi:PHB depolymerase family esterase [Rheinheimera sp. 1928-s]|uniref:extracellular catalytic domain type 2 short-chain-length polyhydroxyalkanoate depolymerase n=1 Tax=Rheinheimera sp. 1928-s TaxID=3033803 RepID=UPI00262FEA7D|nr:PHB depolymerase family esterase [Rheinheimera sp. 1928-s]MDF3124396.1 PHB depolymerase family esterase [Rheinheimera sp. 1928-s]